MSTSGLPDNVHAFLLEHIDSLEQLEVLLLLRRERRAFTGEDAARELRIMAESASHRLSALARKDILRAAGADGAYEYAPRDPDLDRTIGELAKSYQERRVSVINFIATKHLERIKSFADAFKFKGGGK